MHLVWTSEAIRKLEDIWDYLTYEQHAPEAATNVIGKLVNRAPKILDQPLLGRRVPDYNDPNVREVLVKPYRIIYYLQDDVAYMLTVMHQRQLLPNRDEVIRTMSESDDDE